MQNAFSFYSNLDVLKISRRGSKFNFVGDPLLIWMSYNLNNLNIITTVIKVSLHGHKTLKIVEKKKMKPNFVVTIQVQSLSPTVQSQSLKS